MIRISKNPDGTIDEVMARNAYIHLEDMGGAYCLIIDTDTESLNVTIPSPKRGKHRRAWVFEHVKNGRVQE